MLSHYTGVVGLPVPYLSRGPHFARNSAQASIDIAKAKERAQLGDVSRDLEGLNPPHCAIRYAEASGLNHMTSIVG